MNVSEYVKKRNGVPLGHSRSLRNNLERSLGAGNFALFWNFWNPVFGYYLGTKVFRPLKKILPAAIAMVLTFIICGLVHDVVTTLVRGKLSLFFTVWFLLMGSLVVVSKHMAYNLAAKTWLLRATVNLLFIVVCFILTQLLNLFFNFY